MHIRGLNPSHLTVILKPFPLDYHQTLLSLLDILSEVYNKISKILGPSPFPSSGQHMTGPLGLLSPHPGVSYLFTGTEALPMHEGDSSLWGIVNAGSSATVYAGQLGSPPPSWNSTLADSVKQIDNRLKVSCSAYLRVYVLIGSLQKLIATLLKELDDFARTGIRDELASLDPLLRNVGLEDGPNFDFDQ